MILDWSFILIIFSKFLILIAPISCLPRRKSLDRALNKNAFIPKWDERYVRGATRIKRLLTKNPQWCKKGEASFTFFGYDHCQLDNNLYPSLITGAYRIRLLMISPYSSEGHSPFSFRADFHQSSALCAVVKRLLVLFTAFIILEDIVNEKEIVSSVLH